MCVYNDYYSFSYLLSDVTRRWRPFFYHTHLCVCIHNILCKGEASDGPKHRHMYFVRILISSFQIPITQRFFPEVAWCSRNAGGVASRAVNASLYNMFVQAGSIIAIQMYKADDAPLCETR